MGEVYSFKGFQEKKTNGKNKEDAQRTVAIYRSVVYYVHHFMEGTYDHPMEHLTTNCELAVVFEGNRTKFLEAYAALLQHWGIADTSDQEWVRHRELEKFTTLGDLCMYIEKRVKSL